MKWADGDDLGVVGSMIVSRIFAGTRQMVNGEGSVRDVETSFSSMELSNDKSIATSSALSASILAPSSTGLSFTSNNSISSAIDQAKFNPKQALPFVKTRVLRSTSSNPDTSHCFCSNSSQNENRALTKRFRRGLTERWDFTQARELLKSRKRYSPKLFLIHVVKKGETLTSISRLYGVSIQSIVAVNASIVDVDFVLEGQCLNIPFRAEETKMDPGWKIQLDSHSSHEKWQSPLNSLAATESCILSRFLSSHHLQNAKPTGYFLVLVPLIAFCIRCIIGTIQHRVAKDLKHQAANKPKAHNQGSRSIRWKSVLSDSMDSDVADTESSQDSANPPEDLSVPFEDTSYAYTKLEPAYLKFLSECGMSKWGYWRGGSLE